MKLAAPCCIASALVMLALPLTTAASQAPFTGDWVVEQQTRDRWMHGRQQSRFTPHAESRAWLFVDSIRGAGNDRQIHLRFGPYLQARDSAIIVTGSAGRVVRIHLRFASDLRTGIVWPGDSVRHADFQRRRMDGGVLLRESRLWDFALTFPDVPPRAGLEWTDTIARVAAEDAFSQILRGTRRSRIAGDTLVEGRRLWVVHDSASVVYEEHYPEHERTQGTVAAVSRATQGTLRGTSLYDPAIRLFRQRHDTMATRGEAVLRYSDGRAFRTPAQYERMREWTLQDSTRHAARVAQLRSDARRRGGGMVPVPGTELQRRIRDGDGAVLDSLIGEWQRSDDPDARAEILRLLTSWTRDQRLRARLDSLRIADGDTVHLYRRLADRAIARPTNADDVLAMLPFMEDPGIAWGLNVSRDWLYENLVQGLTMLPPAAAAGRDSAGRACTREACALLGAQWQRATEPRLRDVGLVALMSVEPAQWADTVIALAGPQRPLLRQAALLAEGVGATAPAASKAPMPTPGSDWRAWLEWMNGRDPAYAAPAAAVAAMVAARGGTPRDTTTRPRFADAHATAIRFYSARTGRDIVAELRQRYRNPSSDAARLVFGTLLQGLGELRFTATEIAEAFTSGSADRVRLASDALLSQFQSQASMLDPAAAAPIVDRLIAAVIDGDSLWRNRRSGVREPSPVRGMLHASAGDVFVDRDSLPDDMRAKWASRVPIIRREEWERRDSRAASVFYTFSPVSAWGPFARVTMRVSERLARPTGDAPAQYAAGTTFYLMELEGEWVIVARTSWIT